MRKTLVLVVVFSLSLALTACSQGTTAADKADAALVITGQVRHECAWSIEELRAMESRQAEALCQESGRPKPFKGPAINALLDEADPTRQATVAVLRSGAGYSVEVALADLRACPEGIVGVTPKGQLRAILPGLPPEVQVQSLTEIELR